MKKTAIAVAMGVFALGATGLSFGGPKTDVVLRGQTTSFTFDKAGGYGYTCGLPPSMKGTIEVK